MSTRTTPKRRRLGRSPGQHWHEPTSTRFPLQSTYVFRRVPHETLPALRKADHRRQGHDEVPQTVHPYSMMCPITLTHCPKAAPSKVCYIVAFQDWPENLPETIMRSKRPLYICIERWEPLPTPPPPSGDLSFLSPDRREGRRKPHQESTALVQSRPKAWPS